MSWQNVFTVCQQDAALIAGNIAGQAVDVQSLDRTLGAQVRL